MMKIEALPDDLVDELLDKSTGATHLKEPQPEDDTAPVETYACDNCGHCETPGECAWSHECPKCGAPAGKISTVTYCKTPTGGITALHAERWAA